MTTNGDSRAQYDNVDTMEAVGMGDIFDVIGDEQAHDVIDAALQHRADVSTSARDALNAAIDNSGIAIHGFRKPSAAPSGALAERIHLETLDGNHKLAGAVLRVWAETRPDLVQAVTEHLEAEGTPILGPKREFFQTTWPRSLCLMAGDLISFEHEELERHDLALMLCYLSGRFPEDVRYSSDLFSDLIASLESLPPEAPEWSEAPLFATELLEMSTAKIGDRNTALQGAFDATLAEVAEQFEDELRYLDVSIGAWGADIASRPGLIAPAHTLVEALESTLEAYREVRPQAATRSEELQRADERSKREADVLTLVAAWDELMSTPEEDNAADPARDPQEPIGADEPPAVSPEEYASLQTQISNWKQKYEQAQAALNNRTKERDQARKKVEALQTQIGRLERERGGNESLSTDAGDKEPADATEDEPPHIGNVRDAAAAAKDRFPNTLAIALNSASEDDTPFKRPSEVYAALRWLATEYHELRTNPQGADPREFDRRLKAACLGWEYTAKQSDTAKNRFRAEYETTVGDRVYTLDEHVGKGTKGDPQYMVRIAFAWDEDIKKVVVGYIGRHQRTLAS